MTEKIFTEEQYQKIANVGDKAREKTFGLIDSDIDFEKLLKWETPHNSNNYYPSFRSNHKEIMAIINPLTREWAHEQFVEKEKKYYWKSKKLDKDGDHMRLYKIYSGGIVPNFGTISDKSPLTESEIKEWGYNPEAFDREEVK